jgi:hypothetical protein
MGAYNSRNGTLSEEVRDWGDGEGDDNVPRRTGHPSRSLDCAAEQDELHAVNDG